jgi:hypothetical protein
MRGIILPESFAQADGRQPKTSVELPQRSRHRKLLMKIAKVLCLRLDLDIRTGPSS